MFDKLGDAKVIPYAKFYWLSLSHLQLARANEMHQTSTLHMATQGLRIQIITFCLKSDKYLHQIENTSLY